MSGVGVRYPCSTHRRRRSIILYRCPISSRTARPTWGRTAARRTNVTQSTTSTARSRERRGRRLIGLHGTGLRFRSHTRGKFWSQINIEIILHIIMKKVLDDTVIIRYCDNWVSYCYSFNRHQFIQKYGICSDIVTNCLLWHFFHSHHRHNIWLSL